MSEVKKRFVVISGNHPHSGEKGYIEFVDGKTLTYNGMYKVNLLNAAVQSCMALPPNVRLIDDPDATVNRPRSGAPRGRRT